MKKPHPLPRRDALKLAVAGTALPLVHMRTAHAAGRLKIVFWDHWVPASRPVMQALLAAWGEKNKVDIAVDFLDGAGTNAPILLAPAEQSQARTGADIMTFFSWGVQQYQQYLEPVDEVMDGLIRQYGAIDPVGEYLGKANGHWLGVPTSYGSQYKPSCARISFFKSAGFDVEAWYPNKPGDAKSAAPWTWDLLLKLAPQAQQAGLTFGLGLGQTSDSVDFTGALLRSFGGVLVDEKGNLQLRSDAVQRALEYLIRLYPYLPADAVTYDDASNNKILIGGRSALIFNPPSAWWVARRDAIHVAEDCWTFPLPIGPKGRFNPYLPFFWGIWSFSQNKSAAKDLLSWLQQRQQVETLCNASAGYDIPTFASMHDFEIWSTEKPPLGTLYNYPIRPWHDAQASMAAWPAPSRIGTQLYSNATFNVMVVKLAKQKQKMEDVLRWAENEISGYANL